MPQRWYEWKGGKITRTLKYDSPICIGSKFMVNVIVFRYICQMLRWRSQGQTFWYEQKCLTTKSVSLMVAKLRQMLKFSNIKAKGQGQGHKVIQLWYEQKDHRTRNVLVKYDNPTSNCTKVMAK